MFKTVIPKIKNLTTIYSLKSQIPFAAIPVRHSSYQSSIFLEDIPQPSTKYQITRDPVDWEYVKNVLPAQVISKPIAKPEYPSGWKPQQEELVKDRPYFIERTRNHMIPVYLKISSNGIKRHTIMKNIKGDIWQLEKELRPFLQEQSFKPLRLQVHEFAGKIRMNGDFVNAIKYWLEQRGY